MAPDQLGKWNKLAADFPWPKSKPDIPHHPHTGWLNRGTGTMLRENMPKGALVLELGTWRGLSARRMLSRMGAGKIICVDHWKGSLEHTSGCYKERVEELLLVLFEAFVVDTWRYRDDIVPLKMDTLDGLHVVFEYGIQPDLVYLDASHERRPVFNDLVVATYLFPSAIIVGDDWYIDGVKKAAQLFNKRARGYTLEHNKKSFCFKPC